MKLLIHFYGFNYIYVEGFIKYFNMYEQNNLKQTLYIDKYIRQYKRPKVFNFFFNSSKYIFGFVIKGRKLVE